MSSIFMTAVWMSLIGVSDCVYSPVEIGSTVYLRCGSNGLSYYPQWTGPISWTEPNEVYNYNGKSPFLSKLGTKQARLAWGSDNTSLIVRPVEREDTGRYECGSLDYTLEVRVPAEPPEIANVLSINGESSITATEDQQITWACTSRGGYPVMQVRWKTSAPDPDATVQTDAKLDTIEDTYVVRTTYTFTPSREDDLKTYTCQSSFPSSPRLQETTKAKLYLNLKPSQPVVSSLGPLVEGQYNMLVAVCDTEGFRPASPVALEWRFGDITRRGSVAPVPDGTMYRVSDSYNFTSVIGRQDDGKQIYCSVTHPALLQAVTGSITLRVQYRPSLVIENGPVVSVEWGHNVTLKCTAVSRPLSTFTWSLADGDRLAVGGTNNSLKYTLYNIQSGGKYSCSASNGIGEPVTVVVEIVVKGPGSSELSSSTIGAIIGGVTAGVMAPVLLIVALLLWRLCSSKRKPTTESTSRTLDDRPYCTTTDVSDNDAHRYETVGYAVPVVSTYEDLTYKDGSKSVYDSLEPAEMNVTTSSQIYENEKTNTYIELGYEVPVAGTGETAYENVR